MDKGESTRFSMVTSELSSFDRGVTELRRDRPLVGWTGRTTRSHRDIRVRTDFLGSVYSGEGKNKVRRGGG